MTQIRIDTERAREVGRRLIAEGDRLTEMRYELQRAIDSLDTWAWDGRSRRRAEPMLGRVRPESARMAAGLDELGCKLVHAADTFEQEDNTAARNLEGMPWVDFTLASKIAPGTSPKSNGNPDFSRVDGTEEAEYGPVEGQPFILGPGDYTDIHPNDVEQGMLGDCYFLAALAAIASQKPDLIRQMIRDNGDGTYTVTFSKHRGIFAFWAPEYDAVEIVVSPEFPLNDSSPVFAQPGDEDDGQQEFWAMLIEKAYAQHKGGYDDIEGGWGNEALEQLTGVKSEWFSPSTLDIDSLAEYHEEGRAITVSSLPDRTLDILGKEIWDIPDTFETNELYTNDTLITNHEYYVTRVDGEAETVTVRNPWGWAHGETTLSFKQFQDSFQRVSTNSLGS